MTAAIVRRYCSLKSSAPAANQLGLHRLLRFSRGKSKQEMTELRTNVQAAVTQHEWDLQAISKLSRGPDNSDTVLALAEKGDPVSADLVQKLSYLQGQSRIYSKDELDTMQGTLSQALRTCPEHSYVWIPGIQTLARAKKMSNALSTALRLRDSLAEFNCELVMELAEQEGLPVETIMDQEGYKEEARVAVEAVLTRRRAEAAALKDQEEVSVDDLLSALTVTSDV